MCSKSAERNEHNMARFSSAQLTHRGLVRQTNEDSFLVAPDLNLWAVADGLGGIDGGEYASAIAVSSLMRSVRNNFPLATAVGRAHTEILDAVAAGYGCPGMGTTLVALRAAAHRFEVAWAGDSRAYLWNGQLSRLTRDHTVAAYLGELEGGKFALGSDMAFGNQLYKSLGAPDESSVQADSVAGEWSEGDIILLCSDGLTGNLSEETLACVFAEALSLEDRAAVLLRKALAGGGLDNITLVLIAFQSAC
jgi:protein phosphatase